MKLSHPDKILYPEKKITKLDIADYYASIQEWILPQVKQRPLTLVRCPNGWQDCFFQKHITDKNEDLYPITIQEKKSKGEYCYIKDGAGLIALVQLDILEIHAWGCHINHIEKPDRITFDLDPGEDVAWKKVIQAAQYIHKQFEAMHLKSFVMTTGGKGLHVVVPIKPKYSWDQVKNFSYAFSKAMEASDPKSYIATMSKSERAGKIFIDYLRNQRGATSIVPYSTRAHANAPVATPLHWDELDSKIKANTYTIQNIQKRLSQLKKDPWEGFLKLKQEIK